MKPEKKDTLFQPYVIDILKLLEKQPMRFMDIMNVVKNSRTLSSKLKKLKELGLVKIVGVIAENDKYANFYSITKKGKKVLEMTRNLLS